MGLKLNGEDVTDIEAKKTGVKSVSLSAPEVTDETTNETTDESINEELKTETIDVIEDLEGKTAIMLSNQYTNLEGKPEKYLSKKVLGFQLKDKYMLAHVLLQVIDGNHIFAHAEAGEDIGNANQEVLMRELLEIYNVSLDVVNKKVGREDSVVIVDDTTIDFIIKYLKGSFHLKRYTQTLEWLGRPLY